MIVQLSWLVFSFALTSAQQTLDCMCGQSKIGTRVIGGTEAEAHKYPWQVGLVMASKGHNFCAGALINDL